MLWWLLSALALEPVAAVPVYAIEGSSWRMSEPVPETSGTVHLSVYETPGRCMDEHEDEAERRVCAPFVDPGLAQVRIGMQIQHDERVAVALSEEDVTVQVPGAGRGLVSLEPGKDFELIPHDPKGFSQLWVVLVDRSGSMYTAPEGERPAMEKVVGALLSDATLDAFFPKEGSNATGVLLLSFDSEVRAVPRGGWEHAQILESREFFEVQVRLLLDVPQKAGFTHLYDAIKVTLSEVLMQAKVRGFRANVNADPAVIVLTDGFNNEAASDTCDTNAERLTDLLNWLVSLPGRAKHQNFSLHTVGFGAPFSSFEPSSLPNVVTPQLLCGLDVDEVINGNLEKGQIDNVSLAYLAAAGRGTTFVGDDPGGLSEFLGTTGAVVHEWYGLQIRFPDELKKRLRAPLPIRVAVDRPQKVEVRFTLFPHPWFDDAPGELVAGAKWSTPRSVWAATAWLLMGLGATLGFFGFAIGAYHARRAIGRRATARRGHRRDVQDG